MELNVAPKTLETGVFQSTLICSSSDVFNSSHNFTNCSSTSSSPSPIFPTPSPSPNDTTWRPNEDLDGLPSPAESWQLVAIAIVCCVIVTGTVLGNVLVCTAVSIVRKLRTPSNLLIVSLAVSDLLVAVLDMPFATAYEVMGRWVFGQTVCDIWTSLDVLLCTASILNLCMISIDRYFVITRPFQYAMKRTPVRMLLMIAAAWSLSAIISIPPLFGWKTDSEEGRCVVSQEIGYQFYATIGAFYLPLTVMIIIYTRIYLVSYRIAQAEASSRPPVLDLPLPTRRHSTAGASTPLRFEGHHSSGGGARDKVRTSGEGGGATSVDEEENHNLQHNGKKKQTKHHSIIDEILRRSTNATSSTKGGATSRLRLFPKKSRISSSTSSSSSSSTERKATKTLGVIMGAFTACWLPFFILALIKPFCRNPDTCIPHWLNSLFLWLGYANSFLNPIIYARFNRDFRTPFKHILQCRCRDINSRLRSENFAEQFGPSATSAHVVAPVAPVASSVSEGREVSCRGSTTTTAETFVRFSCQGRAVVKLK